MVLEKLAGSVSYIGCGLCIAMSLSAFAVGDRPFYKKPLFWLGLALFSLQWRLSLLFDGFLLENPAFFAGFMTGLFLIAPLMLWQFDQLLSADSKTPRGWYIAGFGIAVIVSFGEIFFQLQSVAERQRIVRVALTEFEMERITLTLAFFFAILLVYISYIFYRFKKANSEFDLDLNILLYSYFAAIYVDAALQFTGFFFKLPLVLRGGMVFHTGVMGMIVAVIWRHPKLFNAIRSEVQKKKYARTSLSGVDVASIKVKLEQLMTGNELYLDENLRIQDLADALRLTVNQLSRILNELFGQNFYEFVGSYRVARAQMLLIQEPKAAILDVAFRSGFNSKSTFHQHFTKVTGLTPSAYRKSAST